MNRDKFIFPLRGYSPNLDFVRGFALHWTFLSHTAHFANLMYSYNPFDKVVIWIFAQGWMGLEIFFVLSGFLITSLLISEREKHGKVNVRNFYIRRSLRVFPLYYFYLVFAFFLLPFAGDAFISAREQRAFLHYALYVPYLIDGIQTPILGHLWTLAIEEHYYLIWPLLFCILSPLASITFLFSCLAVSIGLKIFILFLDPPFSYWWYTIPPTRCDSLIVGSLLAFATSSKIRFWRLKSTYWLLLLGSATVFFAQDIGYKYFFDWRSWWSVYGFLIMGTMLGSAMILFMHWDPEQKNTKKYILWGLVYRQVKYIGKISYGMYIYHMLVILILGMLYKKFLPYFPGGSLSMVTHWWILLSIPAYLGTLAIASVSYKHFEHPLLKIKNTYKH